MSLARRVVPVALVLLPLVVAAATACTIFSGRAPDGTTWIANNEDMVFDFDTWLNVLPADGKQFGALTFTYERPDAFIQGGMNEKCLFLDFNALPPAPVAEYAGWAAKQDYPGGDVALTLHILRSCSTVSDVVEVLRQYRMPCLLAGQMHVADAQGGLAIINVDSVLVAPGPWQVSTNFNVATRRGTPQEASCWRFPVAVRMLEERGVGAENLRAIASATQARRAVSTIYTTLVNLRTGEFALYYGGDYDHPYRVGVRDLLAKGRRSYRMRSLLPDAPITRAWEAYRARGAAAAVGLLAAPREGLTDARRAAILRSLFTSALLVRNDYPAARAFYDAWRALDGGRHAGAKLFEAYARLSAGDYAGAAESLEQQIAADSTSAELANTSSVPGEKALLARVRGEAPAGANVRFELEGHADAKLVCLYGVSLVPFLSPLVRTADGWAGDFTLPPGPLRYAFVVDGKTIRDPANPKHEFSSEELVPLDLSVRVIE